MWKCVCTITRWYDLSSFFPQANLDKNLFYVFIHWWRKRQHSGFDETWQNKQWDKHYRTWRGLTERLQVSLRMNSCWGRSVVQTFFAHILINFFSQLLQVRLAAEEWRRPHRRKTAWGTAALEGRWGRKTTSASETGPMRTWTRTSTLRETWRCSTKPRSSPRLKAPTTTATGRSITARRPNRSPSRIATMRIFCRGNPSYSDRSQCRSMEAKSTVQVRTKYMCLLIHTCTHSWVGALFMYLRTLMLLQIPWFSFVSNYSSNKPSRRLETANLGWRLNHVEF